MIQSANSCRWAQLNEAKRAIAHRDRKDVEYLACALAINADIIWTNDKDFQEQQLTKTMSTRELGNYVYGTPTFS